MALGAGRRVGAAGAGAGVAEGCAARRERVGELCEPAWVPVRVGVAARVSVWRASAGREAGASGSPGGDPGGAAPERVGPAGVPGAPSAVASPPFWIPAEAGQDGLVNYENGNGGPVRGGDGGGGGPPTNLRAEGPSLFRFSSSWLHIVVFRSPPRRPSASPRSRRRRGY